MLVVTAKLRCFRGKLHRILFKNGNTSKTNRSKRFRKKKISNTRREELSLLIASHTASLSGILRSVRCSDIVGV